MENCLPGVYPATKKDGTVYYRSSITYRTRHISLGSFSQMNAAHEAYLIASKILNDSTVTLISPFSFQPLAFEKVVSLINFRDNNLYISTPIYIHRKYFEYYLTRETILKFDMDDLFFYSSHKIMRRGGHLFVTDYGMQTTIVSRYGIKAYAVKDRDYRFVNGDEYDFRYENIEILNSYHGVSLSTHRGKECYKAKIHINGDYVIGYYDSAQKAAIAYNKAVDYLLKAGFTKQYATNYIEGISPALYADIYSEITISKNITKFCNQYKSSNV